MDSVLSTLMTLARWTVGFVAGVYLMIIVLVLCYSSTGEDRDYL